MDTKKKRHYTKKKNKKALFVDNPLVAFMRIHKKKLLIAGIGCGVVFISIVALVMSQLRPIKEIPNRDVKRIPKDVQRIIQALPTASPSANFRIPILMYHYIEYVKDKKDKLRVALNINPNVFDMQIKTLQDAGYTFITMADVAEVLDGEKPLPQKPIVITIDDGHWDLATDVLPILKKYHVKATAYIISGFLGGSDFLTTEQLHTVITSGLVEIGDHTVHHIQLAGKFDPLVKFEVTQSKTDLEKEFHLHIVSFAYPSGSFDQQAIYETKNAGYKTAVSTIPGIVQNQNNRFFLYRIRPGYREGDSLLTYLDQGSFRPW